MRTIYGSLIKLFFLLIFQSYIYASSVVANVDKNVIYKHDTIRLTIEANVEDDNDVSFPDIKKIGDYFVQGVSSSSSTSIINGEISKTISKTYIFTPLKSFTIPSFKVIIDSKTYFTKPIDIKVLKPTQNRQGDKFILNLTLDKHNLRVGESAILKVQFKHKIDAQAQKITLSEPKIDNFWIQKIDGIKKYTQKDYIVQEISYIIFAQKAGKFHIGALEADIGMIDNSMGNGIFNDPFFASFGNSLKWKKIYSNELDIDVKPLPDNLEVYGHFSIKASVDKYKVKANKPVNLTIKISGEGNIDDIKKFDLDIDNAIVYADEPKTESKLYNDHQIKGTFEQKIAIIADNNFTIPSISFKYFDKDTQQVKQIFTQPIKIDVINSMHKTMNSNNLQTTHLTTASNKISSSAITQKVVKGDKKYLKYLFFIFGVIVGSSITYFILNKQKQKHQKKQNHITIQIQKAKDDVQLYELLLPYINDDKVIKDTLKLLEENIYKHTNHQIDKQKLYDYFL